MASTAFTLLALISFIHISLQLQHCGETGATNGVNEMCIERACFNVRCDQLTAGGGWMVTQNRYDGSVDFNRSWSEYVNGFGSPTGELWLGLKHVKSVLDLPGLEFDLRIELVAYFETPTTFRDYFSLNLNGTSKIVLYHGFRLTGSEYRLILRSYDELQSNAGDAMSGYQNGQLFSTYDNDNDQDGGVNCARQYGGGFWYHGLCAYANLNGSPYKQQSNAANTNYGIIWYPYRNYESLKSSRMMIRPRNHQPAPSTTTTSTAG